MSFPYRIRFDAEEVGSAKPRSFWALFLDLIAAFTQIHFGLGVIQFRASWIHTHGASIDSDHKHFGAFPASTSVSSFNFRQDTRVADIFLKIDGIRGESQEIGHVDEIEVTGWTWDIQSASQYQSGAAGGAGKASMSDMEFTHNIDCASPNLMRYALTGQAIPKAVLTMRKAGGTPLDFQKFTLEQVRIAGVKPVGAHGTYVESVKLSFTRITQEYTLQNARGGSMGVVTATFDIRANREV